MFTTREEAKGIAWHSIIDVLTQTEESQDRGITDVLTSAQENEA